MKAVSQVESRLGIRAGELIDHRIDRCGRDERLTDLIIASPFADSTRRCDVDGKEGLNQA